ncbi:hypothetical protein CC80DRAFT_415663 [Byssothecium circinans]|uniref:Uncharacterized protein n=1 Tax=Byssothecium circinans TaxID=147558 RepID=A0A6A5TRR0_9PLEO|nr:hypothetical protein CC80DRAFT_415663 [Byssothecium circinans]
MTTDELSPPPKSVELEDPGAKDLDSSSDEHFSDASEGRPGLTEADRNIATSPIPVTRVERVDDAPAHGEVPGTDAYNKRAQDAVPDEVEVVPEGQRSRSASRLSASDRPFTPGGSPIPKTVVEKIDPDKPSHGDVPGTHAYEVRAADAIPDVVLKVPQPPQRKPEEGSPTISINRSPLNSDSEDDDADEHGVSAHDSRNDINDNGNSDAGDDGDFGDDFDDFEEGGEGDDFGDFDDGFQQGEEDAETSFDNPPDQPSVPAPSPGPPVLDFEELVTLEGVADATQPYIDEIYPSLKEIPSISTTNPGAVRSIFLTDRSESLWSQLVAPPPLQPPDWVRSRIRRLFLVSLGVPVDLDEILPASKQKKLILPSIHIPGEKSPRPSSDGRNGALGRVKRENASSTSVDSSASKSERKRKGPAPPPELDISSTTQLCATTDAALGNFTGEELRAHIQRLQELTSRANEVFEYWQKRKESAMGDKDAFEQVIESLVAHAKKLR